MAWASEMLFIGSSSSKCCGDSLQQALEAWTCKGCWKGAFPVEKPLYRNTNRNKLPLGDKSLLLGGLVLCMCFHTTWGRCWLCETTANSGVISSSRSSPGAAARGRFVTAQGGSGFTACLQPCAHVVSYISNDRDCWGQVAGM